MRNKYNRRIPERREMMAVERIIIYYEKCIQNPCLGWSCKRRLIESE
jgi:hypothetical protein